MGISGPLGTDWFSDAKATALIEGAIERDIRVFDTSPLYGKAEERLGTVIKSLGPAAAKSLQVSTKVGNFLDEEGRRRRDFSGETIRRLVEQSLKRLGLDTLEILYLHGPDEHELTTSLPVLADLQEAGLIRQTGVCSEGSHLARAAQEDSVDVLMGTYNLFDRRHETLFDEASSAGKKITAIAPLGQGLYRRGFFLPKSLADGWYIARALVRNRQQLGKAAQAQWLHEVEGWDAPSLALAFTLANPAVDCAMTTTTRLAHLEANIAAAQRELPHDLMMRLAAIASDR
ncbi:aldo/keto reductase [Parvularcula flava]|uniref:Aldo/keto reductase n=1 Tax=Aquisalinus luteolus TaxID=1566827 RepID=A0A8J3EP01_9PROT|nr:aldo/keto reductase [Aquisalinus luteolus]NHK26641.1 aldo/keto reductase [Aquisalinus luteolus]GGH92961.1 oxidoreductase [Aquisalinus luteolus]